MLIFFEYDVLTDGKEMQVDLQLHFQSEGLRQLNGELIKILEDYCSKEEGLMQLQNSFSEKKAVERWQNPTWRHHLLNLIYFWTNSIISHPSQKIIIQYILYNDMLFGLVPEVFFVSIIGICVFVGFRIRKKFGNVTNLVLQRVLMF